MFVKWGGVKHKRKSWYRHSRGKIVNDILLSDNYVEELEKYDLSYIEPFTLIVVDWSVSLCMYELVWDEKKRHFKELSLESRIWSSSTLYTDEMKMIRRQWFEDFFKENEYTKANSVDFHENYGEGNKDLDLQIDKGVLKTVSITSVVKRGVCVEMLYKDLLLKKDTKVVMRLPSVIYE